jgi:hypothetical protein
MKDWKNEMEERREEERRGEKEKRDEMRGEGRWDERWEERRGECQSTQKARVVMLNKSLYWHQYRYYSLLWLLDILLLQYSLHWNHQMNRFFIHLFCSFTYSHTRHTHILIFLFDEVSFLLSNISFAIQKMNKKESKQKEWLRFHETRKARIKSWRIGWLSTQQTLLTIRRKNKHDHDGICAWIMTHTTIRSLRVIHIWNGWDLIGTLSLRTSLDNISRTSATTTKFVAVVPFNQTSSLLQEH